MSNAAFTVVNIRLADLASFREWIASRPSALEAVLTADPRAQQHKTSPFVFVVGGGLPPAFIGGHDDLVEQSDALRSTGRPIPRHHEHGDSRSTEPPSRAFTGRDSGVYGFSANDTQHGGTFISSRGPKHTSVVERTVAVAAGGTTQATDLRGASDVSDESAPRGFGDDESLGSDKTATEFGFGGASDDDDDDGSGASGFGVDDGEQPLSTASTFSCRLLCLLLAVCFV